MTITGWGARLARVPHRHSLRLRLLLWMLGVGLLAVATVAFVLNRGTTRQFEQFVSRNSYATLFQATSMLSLGGTALEGPLLERTIADTSRLHDVTIELVEADGSVLAASDPTRAGADAPALPDEIPSGAAVLWVATRDGSLALVRTLDDNGGPSEIARDLVSQTPTDPSSWRSPAELFSGLSIQTGLSITEQAGGGADAPDSQVESWTIVHQALPMTPVDNQALFLGGFSRTVLLAVGGALLLLVAMSLALSRRLLEPIEALTRASREMEAGDLSRRVEAEGRDEIGELARAFNSMASQMELTVATLKRFVGDAAHELNTPLTALRTNLELAAAERDPARRATYLRRAEAITGRLTRLTRDLLDLSALESAAAPAPHTHVALAPLLREASELHASRAEQAGIDFRLVTPPAALSITGDRAALRHAISNLIDNAIKFTPRAGRVTVSVESGPDGVEIVVEDTGPGIPADDRPRLFDRFYRGGNAAGVPGSGLGLAIVRAVAERHGGEARAASSPDGSRLSLWLPTTPRPERNGSRRASREHAPRHAGPEQI